MLVGMYLAHVRPVSGSHSARLSVHDSVVRNGVLRCGYVNWKPYYYTELKDGANARHGISVDLMTELGKVLDLRIDWVEEIGWGNIGEGFATRRYDAVCTNMWTDAARLKNLALSRPIFFSAPRLYARANDARFDNNASRINQPDVKIAVIDGAPLVRLVKEKFPRAQIVALPQTLQTAEFLMNVSSGKADVTMMEAEEAREFEDANPGLLKQIQGIPPLRILPHVLALPSDDPQLSAMINSGLEILIDNGEMDRIRKKYGASYFVPAPGFRE